MTPPAPVHPGTPLTVTLPAGVWDFVSRVLHGVPVPGVAHDQMTAVVTAFDGGLDSGLAAWRAAQSGADAEAGATDPA